MNTRLLADEYAQRTGLNCFLPDLFEVRRRVRLAPFFPTAAGRATPPSLSTTLPGLCQEEALHPDVLRFMDGTGKQDPCSRVADFFRVRPNHQSRPALRPSPHSPPHLLPPSNCDLRPLSPGATPNTQLIGAMPSALMFLNRHKYPVPLPRIQRFCQGIRQAPWGIQKWGAIGYCWVRTPRGGPRPAPLRTPRNERQRGDDSA